MILFATTTSYSQSSPDPTPVHISLRKARELAAAKDSAAVLPLVRQEAREWQQSYQQCDAARAQQQAQAVALRTAYQQEQAAVGSKQQEVAAANLQVVLWKATARRRGRRLAGVLTAIAVAVGGYVYLHLH